MRLFTIHRATTEQPMFLVCFWTRDGQKWQQERPLKVSTLAGARSFRPLGAVRRLCPADFALECWVVEDADQGARTDDNRKEMRR